MERRFHKRILAFAVLVSLVATGCDFFGKKEDESATRSAGTLPDGTSVLGSWVDLKVSTSASNNPADALQITYTFSPNQALSIEVRDPHKAGYSCVGFGQYRLEGKELSLFIQAVSPNCPHALNSYQYWGKIERKSASLIATDPTTNVKSTYLLSGSGSALVSGLWNFNRAGGIDWLWLDSSGYFLLQTTDAGQMHLLLGFYYTGGVSTAGGLTLAFIENLDPSQPPQSGLQFEQFVTDGNTLVLYETLSTSSASYTGTRL